MNREDIIRMAREAGWSGIYTQWREPDGSPDWTPVKESLTVPVTMEQIERFAALVAEHERKKRHAAWHEGFEAGRKAERDFCAAVAEWTPDSTDTAHKIAAAIRARGNT